MFNPRAGIVTVYRRNVMYDVPSQVCVTISNCTDWRPATGVVWQRIPELAVVSFFRNNDCQGEIVYTTDPSQSSGSHAFNLGPIGRAIRSLMVMDDSVHPTAGIVNECFPALDALVERVNVTNTSNSTEGGANVTSIHAAEGNTSSNWLDPLPSGKEGSNVT